MNGTLKALSRIGAKKEAERELDRAVRNFNKLAESEPFHNGLWDIADEGIPQLEAALAAVKAAKQKVQRSRASFEQALQPVGGAR